jgi:hypothetical protein
VPIVIWERGKWEKRVGKGVKEPQGMGVQVTEGEDEPVREYSVEVRTKCVVDVPEIEVDDTMFPIG